MDINALSLEQATPQLENPFRANDTDISSQCTRQLNILKIYPELFVILEVFILIACLINIYCLHNIPVS